MSSTDTSTDETGEVEADEAREALCADLTARLVRFELGRRGFVGSQNRAEAEEGTDECDADETEDSDGEVATEEIRHEG